MYFFKEVSGNNDTISNYVGRRSISEYMTYEEVASTLKELGINGITDDTIKELTDNSLDYPEGIIYNKFATMLTTLGIGNYDYDNYTWTPGNNSVYSFDVEVYDIDEMYTLFLQGISSIGEGELEFTNIIEDTSKVNWDYGSGKRSVSFDWNGTTYTLNAKMQSDWFDVKVIKQLNKIIKKANTGKKIYITFDDYQECIVFYRDSEWAKRFEKETGMKLE